MENVMPAPTDIRFQVDSPSRARLHVLRHDGPYGLVTSPRQEHGLGVRLDPRFRVLQPFNPDDGWRFEPREQARDVPDSWSPGGDMEQDLARWARGSAAVRGLSVLTDLPRGRYLLLRCSRSPGAPEKVLMGNDLIPRPPNVRVLRQEEPIFAGIVGAAAGQPPCLDQPLLGLAVLNYVGSFSWQGLLFFPPAAHRPSGVQARGPLLLVVPLDGELVLDNMAGFNPEWERTSLGRWRERYVPMFESWCAAGH